MNIYVYKMVVDDGGAPCVRDGLLSLAICKPVIRRVAQEKSLVFGFAANVMAPEYPGNSLIYVAEVTEKLDGASYYSRKYGSRLRNDQIYRLDRGTFQRRSTAKYHGLGNIEHDLGTRAAEYPNSYVLLSDKFRYFGSHGPLPQDVALQSLLNNLTQGHRCHLDGELQSALFAIKEKAFSSRWAGKQKQESPTRTSRQSYIRCSEGATATTDPKLDSSEDTCSHSSARSCYHPQSA